MTGAPRLRPAGRDGDVGGDVLQILKDVADIGVALDLVADAFAEGVLDVAPDQKDDVAEACLESIIDRVVDDQFAVRSDGIGLLEAAVPASDAAGEDDKGGIRHNSMAPREIGTYALATDFSNFSKPT